jgi:hypothetical protein
LALVFKFDYYRDMTASELKRKLERLYYGILKELGIKGK